MSHFYEEFYKGQRVRFKSWDQMKNEFGYDTYGNINCFPLKFTHDMQYLCGRECVIKGLNDSGLVILEGNISVFCLEMIEPVEDEFSNINESDIFEVISNV